MAVQQRAGWGGVRGCREVRADSDAARVLRIAAQIHAHEHVVFGGMVADDEGFIRKRMARAMRPDRRDLRDWPEIATWAESIAATLTGVVSPRAAGQVVIGD